eukprot:11012238-Alexandrium_andersonii.AAC.1
MSQRPNACCPQWISVLEPPAFCRAPIHPGMASQCAASGAGNDRAYDADDEHCRGEDRCPSDDTGPPTKYQKRRRITRKSPGPKLTHGPYQRESHIKAMILGITPSQYRRLRRFKAPAIVYQLYLFYHCMVGCLETNIDAIDFFAGVANVKKGFQKLGYNACAYDYVNDPQFQNILLDCGFLTAFTWVVRLKAGTGFTHWGTVCSTW